MRKLKITLIVIVSLSLALVITMLYCNYEREYKVQLRAAIDYAELGFVTQTERHIELASRASVEDGIEISMKKANEIMALAHRKASEKSFTEAIDDALSMEPDDMEKELISYQHHRMMADMDLEETNKNVEWVRELYTNRLSEIAGINQQP
jgi:hypothetical protein